MHTNFVKLVLMILIPFNCSLNKSLFGLVAISASSSNGAVAMPQIPSIVRNGTTSAVTTAGTGLKTSVDKTKRVLEAKEIIRTADIVCFDVDSTVIEEEGIDELADFCGKGQEVANLTREAMGGSMTFQEALRRRLDIIKPSQRQIREFLRLKPCTLSPYLK
jgi:phosphoserine phosphatase